MIGQTISHYRILEQIGAGGMGVVYRARDERLDRDVALKVLSPDLVHEKGFLSRFRQEARALSRLNHPNIATVHDFDTVNGMSFLVMEFIKGGTLDRQVTSGPMPESEILRLGIQLLQGLQAAHDAGIIHRDLKPSNLKETPEGRLKILDFGLARIVQTDSETTQSDPTTTGVVGTLPYMAPEQLQGDPVDARTDIYSTGTVLYELATGQRPFTETLAPRLIDCILHRTATFPRELNPQISVGLEAIIRKALEKEPYRRYNSARELCGELERLVTGNAKTSQEPAPRESFQAPPMEIAHVLFTDIVGYSKLPMDEQQKLLRDLQNMVRGTPQFVRARSQDQLISLPTGDGMALVFFGEPESAARCALELNQELRNHPETKLRMGINSGPVYRVADINANRNVAGGGINIAQRVMDCGDAGHILLSKTIADVLGQLSAWQGKFHDLGEVEVKHGVRVHVFNLVAEEAGNPATPQKVQEQRSRNGKALFLSEKMVFAVLLALLATGVGTVVWKYSKRSAGGKSFRPTVAVLGFKNQMAIPQSDWVSTSLSDMLASELAAGDLLVPTPGESVTRMKTDMALPNEASFAPDTIKKVGSFLNCDYVVYGSFLDPGPSNGGTVRLDVRLQNAVTGDLLAAVNESGTELTLSPLAKKVGAALRAKLNLPGISLEESAALQAGIPSTSEALRFYYDGLGRLRNFDVLGARDSLTKATEADPNFSLAHAYLAEAWAALGYDEKAKQEAKSAFDLSTQLGREDKTVVEARFQETSGDWDKAFELYNSLWNLYPETPEYAYRAADVQIRGGTANKALKMIEMLRQQIGPISKDPRLDLKEAEAADSLSDFAKEKQAAKRAADGAKVKGSRLLEAEALWRGCGAMQSLGEMQGAQWACQASIELAKPVGDLLLVARDFTILGTMAAAQGDPRTGLEQHRQALEFARQIGARRDITGALINIGKIQADLGDLAGAQKSFEEALRVAREINDRDQTITLLNNLATLSQTRGNFPEALSIYQQTLDEAQAVLDKGSVDKGSVARARNNIGMICALQGNFPSALKNIQQAVKGAEETGNKSDQAQFLYALGDTKLEQGELSAAEENYQAGLKLATQIGEKSTVALGKLSLSNLNLKAENGTEAEPLAREAADEFHAEGMKDLETLARNFLASALISLNRQEEAAKEMDLVAHLSTQDLTVKLAVAITSGRLQMRSGKPAAAKKELENVASEAKRLGLPGLQFEARLAQGEIALFGGNRRDALTALSVLEKDAAKKGYRQFEARAKLLAQQISTAELS
jgi:serine/threonine protein kinase/tetratricopeptide (TPR) repeat protein